ncbi:MAG: ribonuclease HII [Patescibacteria group bacterium]|nr:ribonuclease HII [Patescibacteria group bacterium]
MEEKLFQKGYKKILAIDEVGRGSLAGPFYLVGIILDKKSYKKIKKIPINDSKKISSKKREKIFKLLINKTNLKYRLIKFFPQKIDKIGIGKCFLLGVIRIYKETKPDFVIIDGKKIDYLVKKIKKITFVIKGDNLLKSLGAASIIAKVLRDNYMKKLAKNDKKYGFEYHKGYGTFLHLKKIKEYGPSKYHRLSFLKSIV